LREVFGRLVERRRKRAMESREKEGTNFSNQERERMG
jgi:hypothetical protein